jgi:hypothetical protein
LSAVTGAGMHGWLYWLEAVRLAKRLRDLPPDPDAQTTSNFIG